MKKIRAEKSRDHPPLKAQLQEKNFFPKKPLWLADLGVQMILNFFSFQVLFKVFFIPAQ
jgi:hypothetical protein